MDQILSSKKATTPITTWVLSFSLLAITLINLFGSFGHLFNADMYLLPGVFRDVFELHAPWFYQTLPPSRYLFPDFALFVPLNFILNNGILAYGFETLLFLVAFTALLHLLSKRFFKTSFSSTLLAITFLCAFATLPEFASRGVTRGLFYPSCHAGGILWGLFTLLLTFKWKESTRSKIPGLLLMLSCFFLGFSDPLCLVTTLPAILLLTMFAFEKKVERFWIAGGTFIATLLGSHLADQIVPTSIFQFMHQQLPSQELFFQKLALFIADMRTPFVLIGILSGILSTALGYQFFSKRHERILLGVLLLIAIFPVAAVLLEGRYLSIDCWHYFPLTFVLAFAGPATVFAHTIRKNLQALFVFILFLLSSLGLFFPGSFSDLFDDTQIGNQLKEIASTLDLKNGAADYWLAIPLNYGIHDADYLAPLDRFGMVNINNNNLAHLKMPFSCDKPAYRNFIMTRGLNENILKARFGEPSRVQKLSTGKIDYSLWIYDHDITPVLMKNEILWGTIAKRMEINKNLLTPDVRQKILKYVNSISQTQP
jgi:hypothetical protein